MSTLSSVTDEYADDPLVFTPADHEPDLDDYGEELDSPASDDDEGDPNHDDEKRHLPARRAPRPGTGRGRRPKPRPPPRSSKTPGPRCRSWTQHCSGGGRKGPGGGGASPQPA